MRTAPHDSGPIYGPIYGPNAPAEVPPVDLRHSIRNLDENTSYAADPAIETAKSMRRSIRGGLRSLLENTDPAVEPLSAVGADHVAPHKPCLPSKPQRDSTIAAPTASEVMECVAP